MKFLSTSDVEILVSTFGLRDIKPFAELLVALVCCESFGFKTKPQSQLMGFLMTCDREVKGAEAAQHPAKAWA